jgi:hypothetical protein
MKYVSSRLSVVKPSASMAVSSAAEALRGKDLDVIDLDPDAPDVPTLTHIVDAAFEAVPWAAPACTGRRHLRVAEEPGRPDYRRAAQDW